MKKDIIIYLLLGILIGYFGVIYLSNLEYNQHIKKTTFDECFDYYATALPVLKGISVEQIEVCKNKYK